MEESMKVNGRMIRDQEMDLKGIRMEIHMKEIFNKIKLKVKEYINGQMVKFMMGNGVKEQSKVMEFGEEYIMIVTLENGKIVRQMDMEFMFGKMEINMKESGKIV